MHGVYLSGDSPQTTARVATRALEDGVYLSGDSPQTTARVVPNAGRWQYT